VRDCETGLPVVVFVDLCLGGGLRDRFACGSVFILVDSRVLAGHSGFCGGFLHVARVVLSICTAG